MVEELPEEEKILMAETKASAKPAQKSPAANSKEGGLEEEKKVSKEPVLLSFGIELRRSNTDRVESVCQLSQLRVVALGCDHWRAELPSLGS